MCMIIAMHYMTKGMNLPKLSADVSLHNIIFRLVFAFCAASVNVYVFISGYFATDAKWSIKKVIELWLEVLFYSILVPVLLNAAGLVDINWSNLTLKEQIFLPISYEHYWFATAYMMMYLFSPVLAVAVQKLDKKQLGTVIIVLVVVFSGFKSVNPYLIPWDKYGDDVIWFMVLYLIAGYIRMYDLPKIPGIVIYILFSILTFLIALVASHFVRTTGKLEYYMDMTLCYNYITVLIASIGLFCAFTALKTGGSAVINRIASHTFGVYLLHENIALRTLWPKLLGIDAASGKWWQIFHMLFCIIIVLAVGVIIDYLRKYIFDSLKRLYSNYLKRS